MPDGLKIIRAKNVAILCIVDLLGVGKSLGWSCRGQFGDGDSGRVKGLVPSVADDQGDRQGRLGEDHLLEDRINFPLDRRLLKRVIREGTVTDVGHREWDRVVVLARNSLSVPPFEFALRFHAHGLGSPFRLG